MRSKGFWVGEDSCYPTQRDTMRRVGWGTPGTGRTDLRAIPGLRIETLRQAQGGLCGTRVCGLEGVASR